MKYIKLKRLLAIYIDFIIIISSTTIITNIITLGNFNLSSSILLKCISVFIFLSIFFLLIISKDLLFKNSSFGKRMLGLGIYYQDGSIPSNKILINRNLNTFLLFPIDILFIVFDNQTRGDKTYNTNVDYLKKHR